MKKDVFGTRGDFTTAPEVSQMFGEVRNNLIITILMKNTILIYKTKLIGVWLLNEWMLLKNFYKNDLPSTVQLIEMGPGRGTLMNDVLRIWSRNNEATSDLFVYMIETSSFMRKTQFSKLCAMNGITESEPKILEIYASKISPNIKITWLTDIKELPKKEAAHFFVANEFFDALPIQKFQVL
jgi:NADH dehydrogenase [ubiquinone] 1 alpha subcomplex assembly factor 7